MTVSAHGEADWLRESAAAMDLLLSERDAAVLLRYLDLLTRWNAVYNLTAVRDRDSMRTQHLLDCLAIVEPFRRATKTLPPAAPKRVLDVGSGGGLPGVVLSVLLPDWTVVCVDTVGKKSAFVRQVASELAVPNLKSVHARVEKLDEPPFGVITARAFSSLSQLADIAGRHLAPGGVYLAMKGKAPNDEIAELADKPTVAVVFHVEPLTVPGLNAERCIVWLRTSTDPTHR